MKHLLITGATGQLGGEFRQLAGSYPHWHFHFAGRETIDLADPVTIRRWFEENPVDYCINCAAYTAVDRAEGEADRARQINARGPAELAAACAGAGASLIHFSTDYVYHTGQNTPYLEDDPTHPRSVYASTKLEGEQRALEAHPRTTVIRTSWVYSAYGHNFVKTMLRLGRERRELRVVFDQIGTPTHAADLAAAVLQMIDKKEQGTVPADALSGIFNYSNEGVTSWYDFALAIFDEAGVDCRVLPIETSEYPTPARRPPFSVMNKKKIRNTFGLEIPHWQQSLRRCLQQIHLPG